MNDLHVRVSYPDPTNNKVARISMNVFKVGDALLLSKNGELFEFDIGIDEAARLLDVILLDCSDRHQLGLYPYRESYRLNIDDTNSVQIDSEIAAELAGALFCVVVEADSDDVFHRYPSN
jgi:hypothetical protein